MPDDWIRANTDWFRDARWGVFMHYLADVPSNRQPVELSPDEWNRRIDAFDAEGLAIQLADLRVPYFIITLGQNAGFYLSPNETYDSIVGRKPSRLSHRDLIADLIAAFKPRGIRLMVYLPIHAPALDSLAIEALKCTPLWDGSGWGMTSGSYKASPDVDDRLTEFQRNWEAVIQEWSRRWGKGVGGWWFDGCYYADRMYRSAEEPNFRSFASSVKAGNPDSLVAWNPGVKIPVVSVSEYEDYTAGEIAIDFPTRPVNWESPHEDYRYIDGAQYHILSFLGKWWSLGPLRFSDEFVIGYTKHVNGLAGVITWDVAPTPAGRVQDEFMRQIQSLRTACGV